jgi:hypothetical protein
MKQETLEEGITKYLRTLNGDEYKSIYDFCNQQTLAFINGAKWQQEQQDELFCYKCKQKNNIIEIMKSDEELKLYYDQMDKEVHFNRGNLNK